MSADADRLKEIERTSRHALATRPTETDSWLNGYQEDIPYLLALVQGMREREKRLTDALEAIRDMSPCVIRGAVVSKHSGRFCAHHVASNGLAVLASGPDTDSST